MIVPFKNDHNIGPIIACIATYYKHDARFPIVADTLYKKIAEKNTETYVALSDNTVVCIAIIEWLEKSYGNIWLHSMQESDEWAFAQALAPCIHNTILELIQFTQTFHYRDAFIDMGYHEKERMRMVFSEDAPPVYIRQDGVSFEPLTHAHNRVSAAISWDAHRHRQHMECYGAYNTVANRSQFAQQLRMGVHGDSIVPASILMRYNNQPIGCIEMVAVDHGPAPIAWIMDIAIVSAYQSKRLGGSMVGYALDQAYAAGYPTVGLSVTLDNTRAVNLYKRLGFVEESIFVEIMAL